MFVLSRKPETKPKPAHPNTIRRIHQEFQTARLDFRQQSTILWELTGKAAQQWTDIEAEMVLAILIAKGNGNLAAWADQLGKKK